MLVLFGVTTGSAALAAALDSFGAPPEGDPSAWTGPSIGTDMAIEFLQSLAPANEGAEEGGNAGAHGAIAESDLRSGGSYDIPTGGPPSPLFGAGEFEQRMILFEEFGRHQVEGAPTATLTFPLPMTGPAPEQDPTSVAASSPDGFELDVFLAEEGFVTFPSRESNTSELNRRARAGTTACATTCSATATRSASSRPAVSTTPSTPARWPAPPP